MPIFGDNDQPDDAATLAPISTERIADTLTQLEVNFGTDDDGDIVAGFEGNPCWFRVAGPGEEAIAFSFNTRWRANLPADRASEALEAVNEWNVTQMFPRALVVPDEDGSLILGADYTSDHEFGLTDLQLSNDITIAITTAINYFEFLDERFGDDVTADEG